MGQFEKLEMLGKFATTIFNFSLFQILLAVFRKFGMTFA